MMSEAKLSGQVAVITGASRGIGRDVALTFAREGASLVLVCLRDQKALTAVQQEVEAYGARVIALIGDVSEVVFCESVYSASKEAFGVADILVNCAGTITRAPFEEMSLEDWHRVIDVNLHGAFYMCRQFIPDMRAQKHGKVINMTSQMAHMPHPSASPSYEVSKAGLTALTRHLAYQYAPYNICVNAIAPGSIDTDMPKSMTETARERLRNGVPMKRLGEPEEVGECALFLASDMSNYVTGTTLHVNGGSLMK
ncbi:MAG: 3-oxoacyl-ACP reductase FabG [Gammaproteobacteria bacterium]|jgi:3-oxoacyl-[acyl-carrier protein] reductase|nr:3-oxoacyl-ACP reductase FabG [Candidatus Neomarinimicrobiota bacterium]MBT4330917.1 3-oxoacyl-ACP reductase FabG [Gammaproteobacteria bacterium]